MPEIEGFVGKIEQPEFINATNLKATLFESFAEVYQKDVDVSLKEIWKKLLLNQPLPDSDALSITPFIEAETGYQRFFIVRNSNLSPLSRYIMRSVTKELRKPIQKKEIKFRQKLMHFKPNTNKRRYHK